MIDTITDGKQRIGLTDEQRRHLRERHLAEQEAQLEQARLVYCAAKAAVEAVRREIEGPAQPPEITGKE